MAYRNLQHTEIEKLKKQGCTAETWESVRVTDPFDPERIQHVRFFGNISLGIFNEHVTVKERGTQQTGIYHSTLRECTVGDNALIQNVQNLYRYDIQHHAVLDNIRSMSVTGLTSFGNGVEIEVLNEGGGRELPIYNHLSAQIAYMLVHFRYHDSLTKKLLSLIETYCESVKSDRGTVGSHVKITDAGIIRNVEIGPGTEISGADLLEEGTLAGSPEDPVRIGQSVIAKHFIVQSGSHISDGVLLDKCFVGQGVRLGKQFSAEGSAFFANSEGYHGEAVSLFAGPYTVTHHKSTLLIAGMFSFYNAGSGTNQSNHMYKLGPIHQGILERGAKTGSLSYMLWPCTVGAFSVVTGKHTTNFEAADFPFSYITAEDGKSQLTPAMNLFTVGTRRDSEKWPARDRRKDSRKYDRIHFDLFNPRTIGNVLKGMEILEELSEKSRREQEYVSYKGLVIKRLLLRSGLKYYRIAVAIYIGEILLKLAESLAPGQTLKEKLAILPGREPEPWFDLAGMLVSKSRLESCINAIVQSSTNSVDDVLNAVNEAADAYNDDSLLWWAGQIRKQFNVEPKDLSDEQTRDIIENWKSNVLKLNNMILKDAEKEFDPGSHMGYGLDGDEDIRNKDFTAVRGTYDDNKFVKGLVKENSEIEQRADNVLKRLKLQ
jgi:hypothetical protein